MSRDQMWPNRVVHQHGSRTDDLAGVGTNVASTAGVVRPGHQLGELPTTESCHSLLQRPSKRDTRHSQIVKAIVS